MCFPQVRALLPGYQRNFLRAMNELMPGFPFFTNLAGLLVGTGVASGIYAIAHLKASFGLCTPVRQLVTTGPYHRIRHPLYFGEIIHVFGIAILAAATVALALFVIAVGLQLIRAEIGERKFHRTVPEYAEFARRTGILWPKLS